MKKHKWFQMVWRQPGGLEECPYFKRTVISLFGYSVRVHEWYADDDSRCLHDHPTDFVTLVLKGGYIDSSENGLEVMKPGTIRYRKAEFKHSVIDVIPGTITLLFFFKPRRRWGFWKEGKYITRDKYFAEQGHHPCDPLDNPVRMKPGGGRI